MYLFILYFFLAACSANNEPIHTSNWLEIKGRNEENNLQRVGIYRAKVPVTWQRNTPTDAESFLDTTKPIEEFSIEDGKNKVRIVVHNFPTNEIEDRIPPSTQVARWKRQFDKIDATDIIVSPEAHGGFAGLFFSGIGISKGHPYAVLGWSMQLAPEHYRTLKQNEKIPFYRQMSADYTIKAMGSPEAIQKHKKDIVDFANSFELIQEIPTPL